jgi:hypothetical protein
MQKRNCIYYQGTTNVILSDYFLEFNHFHFHVKLCFGMIISKAEGQFLKNVDTDLRQECFSHM